MIVQGLKTGEVAETENKLSTETLIFDCDGVLIDSEIIVFRIAAEELTPIVRNKSKMFAPFDVPYSDLAQAIY
jgi:phosphoglycolate phosphatase-like HAD superfamily hydrolase